MWLKVCLFVNDCGIRHRSQTITTDGKHVIQDDTVLLPSLIRFAASPVSRDTNMELSAVLATRCATHTTTHTFPFCDFAHSLCSATRWKPSCGQGTRPDGSSHGKSRSLPQGSSLSTVREVQTWSRTPVEPWARGVCSQNFDVTRCGQRQFQMKQCGSLDRMWPPPTSTPHGVVSVSSK